VIGSGHAARLWAVAPATSLQDLMIIPGALRGAECSLRQQVRARSRLREQAFRLVSGCMASTGARLAIYGKEKIYDSIP
jgi:hypothetical protein